MAFSSLPVVIQAEKNECGPACLLMILGYYGYKTDLATLREKFPISQHGENIGTIIQIANELKLDANPLRLDLEELPQLKLPAILHWDMNHFVVLKKINRDKYFIHDPAVGAVTIPLMEVDKHFTGVALELEPNKAFAKANTAKKLTIRDVWENSEGLQGIKKGLLLSFGLSLLLLLFSLVLPFYSQIVIDEVAVNGDTELVVILALGFLFITITRVFSELIRSNLLLQLGSHLSFSFASGIYRHLLRLKSEYFLNRHIGDITSRFRSLNNIREFISSGVVGIIIDGLLVVITLSVMFLYNLALTSIALVAVFLYAIIKTFTYRRIEQLNTGVLIENGKENTIFIENIRAIQGIKLFGREPERTSVWLDGYANVINAGITLQKNLISIQFANNFLLGAGNVLLIFLGALAVLDGALTIGMLIAYLQFKDQFYSRVFTLLDKAVEFKLLDVHLGRLSDIIWAKSEKQSLSDPPVHTVSEAASELSADSPLLSVHNLAFRYSPSSPLLFRNIDFSIDDGEIIAIVGPTGCGKSTLLKVILSLLSPEEGCIRFRGKDIKQLGVDAYRSQVAAILQDDNLISGSIYENITFFDKEPDDKKVEEAAKSAGMHHEIMALPMGYDTSVGNMGAALSGGQVQRIMLARAFYKGAKLIITDEATSHLDVKKEREVMAAFSHMNVARIIVAHRPTSILFADGILELTPFGLKEIEKSAVDSGQVPEIQV